MTFEAGFQERHRELREVWREYIRENSYRDEFHQINLEFDLDPDYMIELAEGTNWSRNGSLGHERVPVEPWEFLDKEEVKQMRPESNSELMDDFYWIAESHFETPDQAEDARLQREIANLKPEMALLAWKKHEKDLNEAVRKIGEEVFKGSQTGREGLLNLKAAANPDLKEYRGEPSDVVRAIENADQRASMYMADMLSVPWMEALDQELYRAGWDYDNRALITVYTSREDGFIDMRQHTV